jgi:hypothetical protein
LSEAPAVANKYRFMPSMVPGVYVLFDAATLTRVPGEVTVSTESPRVYTYTRHLPVPGRKPELVSITASSVRELSQKIDDYFNNGDSQ